MWAKSPAEAFLVNSSWFCQQLQLGVRTGKLTRKSLPMHCSRRCPQNSWPVRIRLSACGLSYGERICDQSCLFVDCCSVMSCLGFSVDRKNQRQERERQWQRQDTSSVDSSFPGRTASNWEQWIWTRTVSRCPKCHVWSSVPFSCVQRWSVLQIEAACFVTMDHRKKSPLAFIWPFRCHERDSYFGKRPPELPKTDTGLGRIQKSPRLANSVEPSMHRTFGQNSQILETKTHVLKKFRAVSTSARSTMQLPAWGVSYDKRQKNWHKTSWGEWDPNWLTCVLEKVLDTISYGGQYCGRYTINRNCRPNRGMRDRVARSACLKQKNYIIFSSFCVPETEKLPRSPSNAQIECPHCTVLRESLIPNKGTQANCGQPGFLLALCAVHKFCFLFNTNRVKQPTSFHRHLKANAFQICNTLKLNARDQKCKWPVVNLIQESHLSFCRFVAVWQRVDYNWYKSQIYAKLSSVTQSSDII